MAHTHPLEDRESERLARLADRALQHGRDLLRAELRLARLRLAAELTQAVTRITLLALGLVCVHGALLGAGAAVALASLGHFRGGMALGAVALSAAAGAGLLAHRAFKRDRRVDGSDSPTALVRTSHE